MHEICRHLQTLLRSIYCHIYDKDPETVEFLLVPMPRLEIETIGDFKILHEIGALTPDMSVRLSGILLGEDPHSKRSRQKRGGDVKRPEIMEGVKIAPGKTIQQPAGKQDSRRTPPEKSPI